MNDTELIVHHCKAFADLKGARIFLTGGTGFFGVWLLDAFAEADRALHLGATVRVLSRDPAAFVKKHPRFADAKWLEWQQGDVTALTPNEDRFTHVIHAATTTTGTPPPLVMFDTVVDGTRRALEVAARAKTERFLMISSGAVYGRQPPEITHVPETYVGAPDCTDPHNAYGEGKRAAEFLSAVYAKEHGFTAPIARCFAFSGPYLPLDQHFAIGNFVGDGLKKKTIEVKGDGTPYRSYLYASDLVIWLLEILTRGQSGRPYNVGSDRAVSIAETARAVAAHFGVDVTIAKAPTGAPAERYVPSATRAKAELGLNELVSLEEGIAKMAVFHRA